MLQSPKSGDNILAWARKATKEINSNIIHNGIGIKVLRTPQGTNISVKSGRNVKGSAGDNSEMPFDVNFKEFNENDNKIYVEVKYGDVYYNLGTLTTKVTPLKDVHKEVYSFGLEEGESEGDNMILLGLTFNYSDSEDGMFPETWSFDVVPDSEDEAYSDITGVKYFPLFLVIVHTLPEGTEVDDTFDPSEYPVAWQTTVNDGTGDKLIVGIQLYHGDVHVTYSVGAPVIAEISGESSAGSYTASAMDFNQETGTIGDFTIQVCELAYTDALPAGSRVIAHPGYVLAYSSGTGSII